MFCRSLFVLLLLTIVSSVLLQRVFSNVILTYPTCWCSCLWLTGAWHVSWYDYYFLWDLTVTVLFIWTWAYLEISWAIVFVEITKSRFQTKCIFRVIRNQIWFGLWCLTPLSTIFQLYCGGQFYWWRKLEYLEKTTDLS